ncbi:MAG TPA: rhamnulokinase family protein [Caldilineaceae bacterium]|nr:rhamnulokinase family protein [Caldilineaceae bacterium]
MTQDLLAFDLGAESGRALLGRFDGDRITLADLHRFPNTPVRLPGGLHWNVLQLWQEIKHGIALAHQQAGVRLSSIGIDTWGVDFALLDRSGALVGNPFHYRDSRSDGMVEAAFARVPRAEIFAQTGIQFMPINTLYQLVAMVQNKAPALEIAQTFLTIPDLFNYWLTGRKVCEFSNATTTQCYNPLRRGWALPMLSRLGIPTHIFPEIVQPGTVLGELLPGIAAEVGLASDVPVIAPACHDTGSAVAAAPAAGKDFAWISSGTWSIVGAEVAEAVVNEQSLAFNFTNEGGVNQTFRLSKNVAGLWIVQECRRAWARQGEEYSYADLTALAARATPFQAVIDPDDLLFLKPSEVGDEMPDRVRSRCQATGQPAPADKGALIRCVLESLALKYRWVLEKLETIMGKRLDPLHIVGGGTQNGLLCQFTADATGRSVVAGPVEATAIGNLIVQAMALGLVGSLAEGRELVRRSFAVMTYEPAAERQAWDAAYLRLATLVKQATA